MSNLIQTKDLYLLPTACAIAFHDYLQKSNKMSAKLNRVTLYLNIGDQLTTISCGHVVVELIKFIAYQRLQIPFAYQWLKQIVTKKKEAEHSEKENLNFQAERHFRIACMAIENLDFINKSLLQEISGSTLPEEVCIALGATPVTIKEVYRLLLPTVCHKPQCHSSHIASDQKIQRSIFKTLVTSDKLSHIFFNPLPPTNTYVFIKKKFSSDVVNGDNFVSYSGCRIPRSSKIVVIDMRSQTHIDFACCNEFQVFGDAISRDLVNLQIDNDSDNSSEEGDEFSEIESTDEMKWYQSTYVMKGFKDCTVNGSSVTNLWLQS